MLNKSDCTSQRQDLFLQLHSSQMVCQHFHATQTTGMGHAKCHLRAKWCDSWGVLSFGQCREITWWDTSHVQPASYSGTPTQELHHSQVPLVGRSRWRIPTHPTGGSLGTVNACVTHTSFLIPISPALGMNKISLCMGCQFWDICANKDQLEKALGRSGRPHNFSTDNDGFCYPNTKQEENLLVMQTMWLNRNRNPFPWLIAKWSCFFLTGLYSLSFPPVQGNLSPESQGPEQERERWAC